MSQGLTDCRPGCLRGLRAAPQVSGPVTLRHAHVVVTPRDPQKLGQPWDVAVTVEARNHLGRSVAGWVTAVVTLVDAEAGGCVVVEALWSVQFQLGPGEAATVAMDAAVQKPRLWWPVGCGRTVQQQVRR